MKNFKKLACLLILTSSASVLNSQAQSTLPPHPGIKTPNQSPIETAQIKFETETSKTIYETNIVDFWKRNGKPKGMLFQYSSAIKVNGITTMEIKDRQVSVVSIDATGIIPKGLRISKIRRKKVNGNFRYFTKIAIRATKPTGDGWNKDYRYNKVIDITNWTIKFKYQALEPVSQDIRDQTQKFIETYQKFLEEQGNPEVQSKIEKLIESFKRYTNATVIITIFNLKNSNQ